MSRLIPILSKHTGLTESDVMRIIVRAPRSYKHYTIDKRTGGKRLISQPAREVKALQRIVVRLLVDKLPIHNAATAYRQHQSIRHNALKHAHNGPIIKFDFQQFFPSIKDRDWLSYCITHKIFTESVDIDNSAKLLFHRSPGLPGLRLAIGAPSSPWLSNVLMFEFDKLISSEMLKNSVVYTRYADDLTFSARRTGFLTGVEKTLRRVIREVKSPNLQINENKTVLATKKYRRVVTGLVLANDGRVTLGRDRKRMIRAELHHALNGKGDADSYARLIGILAFVQDVEPLYFVKLTAHYGGSLIDRLQKLTPSRDSVLSSFSD